MLELSSEPSITKVPGRPAFASDPCAISDASAAYTRGLRHAVHFRTSRSVDLHHFMCQQGWTGYPVARFRVAQRRVGLGREVAATT